MIQFKSTPILSKNITVVLLTEDQVKSKKFKFQHAKLKSVIGDLAKAKQFTGQCGQIIPVYQKDRSIVLLGLGAAKDLTPRSLRVLVRKVLRSSFVDGQKDVEIVAHDSRAETVRAIVDGDLIGTYSWTKYKTAKNKSSGKPRKTTLITSAKREYADFVTTCGGVNLARDLINENADVANSAYLEGVIRRLVKGRKNVSVTVLNKKEMKAKGLNLHLAVNQGSEHDPKLVIVKYRGGKAATGYTALVGKGLTFDTGGLNLKPSGHIESMRCDMSGAAAVIGTLKNVLDLKLKKNVLFVFGLAENATGSRSYKPGDIFKSYSGKTVEIGNTDAEGRLVLADAIAYTIKNYKPKRLIDIATLTGACIVALGHDYTGLVTLDDKFSRQLIQASNETDDRAWRLPSYPELKDSVTSQFADIRNLGFPKGAGGTITAAEFLRQFADGTTWAHLDIAGTAFVDGAERAYFGHGGTGAGVRLLTQYLKNN